MVERACYPCVACQHVIDGQFSAVISRNRTHATAAGILLERTRDLRAQHNHEHSYNSRKQLSNDQTKSAMAKQNQQWPNKISDGQTKSAMATATCLRDSAVLSFRAATSTCNQATNHGPTKNTRVTTHSSKHPARANSFDHPRMLEMAGHARPTSDTTSRRR